MRRCHVHLQPRAIVKAGAVEGVQVVKKGLKRPDGIAFQLKRRAAALQARHGLFTFAPRRVQRHVAAAFAVQPAGRRQHIDWAIKLNQRRVQRLANRGQQLTGGHLLFQTVEPALLLLLALLGTVGDHHQRARRGAVDEVAAGFFTHAGQRPAGHRQPADRAANHHRQDLLRAGPHFARGNLELDQQLFPAAVRAERFVGEIIHHHPILLIDHDHGGGDVIEHRFH